jgi:8-oxo-dGTP pyrophosphatase MutT (NUDIX family)
VAARTQSNNALRRLQKTVTKIDPKPVFEWTFDAELHRSRKPVTANPSLDKLRESLAEYRPEFVSNPQSWRRAAVAAVLREWEERLELLFIRRAEHPDDPWSGHMAFPGGRVDETDADGRAAAERETLEELALDLRACGRALGRLSDLRAVGGGLALDLFIEPWVYAIEGEPELVPDHREVREFLWVPVSWLADRDNLDTLEYPHSGAVYKMPCYRYQGRVIWGLTYRMLHELLELMS